MGNGIRINLTMKNLDKYNCIVCDKEIKSLDKPFEGSDDDVGMWNDGIVAKISAGYGSGFDGGIFMIAICDECIKKKEPRVIGDYLLDHGKLTEKELEKIYYK